MRMAAPLGLGLFDGRWSRGFAPGYGNAWPFGPEDKTLSSLSPQHHGPEASSQFDVVWSRVRLSCGQWSCRGSPLRLASGPTGWTVLIARANGPGPPPHHDHQSPNGATVPARMTASFPTSQFHRIRFTASPSIEWPPRWGFVLWAATGPGAAPLASGTDGPLGRKSPTTSD